MLFTTFRTPASRHVQRCRLGAPPALPNGRGDFLRLASIDVRDQGERAVSRKLFAQGSAKAGGPAGHKSDAVGKFVHWCCQSATAGTHGEFLSHGFVHRSEEHTSE